MGQTLWRAVRSRVLTALPLVLVNLIPIAVPVEVAASPSEDWAAIGLAIRATNPDPALAAGLAAAERAAIESVRGRSSAFVHADAIVVVDEVHPSDLAVAWGAMARRLKALSAGKVALGEPEEVEFHPLPLAVRRPAAPLTLSDGNVRIAVITPDQRSANRVIRRPIKLPVTGAGAVKFPAPITRLEVRARPRKAGAFAYAVDMAVAVRAGAELWLEPDRTVVALGGRPRSLDQARSTVRAALERVAKSPKDAARLRALWALRAPINDVVAATERLELRFIKARAREMGVELLEVNPPKQTAPQKLKIAGAIARPNSGWLSYTIALFDPKAPTADTRALATGLKLDLDVERWGAEASARAIPGAVLVNITGPARLKSKLEAAVARFTPRFVARPLRARSTLSLNVWDALFKGAFRGEVNSLSARAVFVEGPVADIAPKTRPQVALKNTWRPQPTKLAALALPLEPRIDRAGPTLARLIEVRASGARARYERGPRAAVLFILGDKNGLERPVTRSQLRAALEAAAKDRARNQARVGARAERAAVRFVNHAEAEEAIKSSDLLRLSQVLLVFNAQSSQKN